jgi:hypothetical protein
MQRRQAFSFSQLARQQAGFLRFFPGQPFIIKIARFPEQYFILGCIQCKDFSSVPAKSSIQPLTVDAKIKRSHG